MAFSQSELQNIENSVAKICDRIPEHVRDQLRHEYTINNHSVTMEEVRPSFITPGDFTRTGFAKFQFVRTQLEWQLYWMRATGKWQTYDPCPSSKNLDELVDAVLEDAAHCFFG